MAAITYRPTTAQWVVGSAILLGLVLYPFLVTELFTRFGVRGVAAAGLASLGIGFALRRGSPIRSRSPERDLGLPALALGAALVSGAAPLLLLLPALINLQLFFVCRDSLREDPSIIEQMARHLQPQLPAFTRGYCRGCTAFWAGFFLVNVVLIAVLAFAAPVETWRVYTGPIYLAQLGVIGFLEFVIRKIYFRYYVDNWFDRVFSAWFPAEATERGRRSAAYIASFSSAADAAENDARNQAS